MYHPSSSAPLLLGVDVDAVHQSIREHNQAIILLDKQIEELLRNARQLQSEKIRHEVEIRKCKGKITLASRLPPEILATIFEMCVLDGRTRTPLVVSHVCSSWRKAAFIPTVWSHVYVNLDSRDPHPRTQLWVKRSQDTPLTIELKIGNDISHLNGIMKLLAPEARRWKKLIINSTLLEPVNQVLESCDTVAPRMLHVEISVDQEFFMPPNAIADGEAAIRGLRTLSTYSPNLLSVSLHRNIVPGHNDIPSFITNLTLHLPCRHAPSTTQSVASIIALLEELHDLETFTMQVPNNDSQMFQLNAPSDLSVSLPKLKILTLMGANNIFGLLPHINAPILAHLVLRSSLDLDQSEETGQWILRLLQESSFSVTLLDMRDLVLEPAMYSRFFHLLPKLEDLRLHDSDILDPMLLPLQGPNGLCPSLQRLDFRWCGRLTGRALVNLVRSRLPDPTQTEGVASTAINEVTLINCSFVKEEDILDLAEMTVCRLIHRGHTDFCSSYACCDNERYRRRLKQRCLLHPSIAQKQAACRLIF